MDPQPVGPSSTHQIVSQPEPAIHVAALHALECCERRFYLEEVEEIRIADERVECWPISATGRVERGFHCSANGWLEST
jgi:hypothetical protein